MDKFLFISLGAIFGANARYWISQWAATKWGPDFPYGTMMINISGSLLMGFLMTVLANRIPADPRMKLLLTVGFLGAYTTFSTYAFESLSLFTNGQWLSALWNIFGSTLLGLIAVGLGIYIGRLV